MAVFCVKKFNCISHRILRFQFVIGGGVSEVPTLKTYHVIFGHGYRQRNTIRSLFDSDRHKYCSAYFKDWAGVAKVMKSVIFQDIFFWKPVSQKLKVGGVKVYIF